jgi:hypothetical protein
VAPAHGRARHYSARAGAYDEYVNARAHWAPFIVIMAMGLAAGCGASGSSSSTTTRRHRASTTRHAQRAPALPTLPQGGNGQPLVPTPGPTGIPARPAAVAVIRAWADALRHGDVRGAARYFALPSIMINGTDAGGAAVVITISTVQDAVAANETLPCGARFVSADQRGRYVNALFRLTGRPGLGGSSCDGGVGETARTNFVIAGGRIVEWIRAPDDPGDNSTPAQPAPVQPAPAPAPTPTIPQTPGSSV